MENPECTLLSVVKVEENEMKDEASNGNLELEFVQVEDSMSVGETSSEHDMLEIGDSVNSHVSFSEGEMGHYDRSFNFSKMDGGTRKRLRFSESDDLVLLRRVAALNPYKCSGLWKEVTQVVAMRAGKNFSVRSIREHTDLLMNTLSLRGAHACLKRTPPELWDKKKRLLHIVHSLWKKDSARGAASSANKLGAESADLAKLQSRLSKTARVESPLTLNSSSVINNDSCISTSSSPKLSSVPLLMQQPNVPFTMHLGTAIQSLACPPLLFSSTHNNMQPQALTSQSAFQKLPITPVLPSAVLGTSTPCPRKLTPADSGITPDVVNECKSPDKPPSLTTSGSYTSNSDSTGSQMVDHCTSPIPSFECSGNGNITVSTQYDPGDVQNGSLTASVVSSTDNMNTESHILEWTTERRRRKRKHFITRSNLNFLQKRHMNRFSLKRRELELEKRKIVLEEKKLILDERKVQLEEEKWLFDKKEREEKILIMTEEREHKMAMERRQQNMIDLLLEFKKKD